MPSNDELARQFQELWVLQHQLQTELATRPDCAKEIQNVRNAIYGQDGFQVQIATLKERLANLQWWFRIIAGSCIGLGAEALSRLLG